MLYYNGKCYEIYKKQKKNVIVQISIYIFELFFVISILTKITLIIFPLENIFSWQLIERIIGLYTVYQIFIFATLNQIDDSEKDSYNTLKLLCEETLIYFKCDDIHSKSYFLKYLIKSINAQLSPDAMNSDEIINEYKKLLNAIIYNNVTNVELLVVECNHWLNHLDLKFTKSLFLRYFKDPSFKLKWRILIVVLCVIILKAVVY